MLVEINKHFELTAPRQVCRAEDISVLLMSPQWFGVMGRSMMPDELYSSSTHDHEHSSPRENRFNRRIWTP